MEHRHPYTVAGHSIIVRRIKHRITHGRPDGPMTKGCGFDKGTPMNNIFMDIGTDSKKFGGGSVPMQPQ
jgi:hypothetical protein